MTLDVLFQKILINQAFFYHSWFCVNLEFNHIIQTFNSTTKSNNFTSTFGHNFSITCGSPILSHENPGYLHLFPILPAKPDVYWLYTSTYNFYCSCTIQTQRARGIEGSENPNLASWGWSSSLLFDGGESLL